LVSPGCPVAVFRYTIDPVGLVERAGQAILTATLTGDFPATPSISSTSSRSPTVQSQCSGVWSYQDHPGSGLEHASRGRSGGQEVRPCVLRDRQGEVFHWQIDEGCSLQVRNTDEVERVRRRARTPGGVGLIRMSTPASAMSFCASPTRTTIADSRRRRSDPAAGRCLVALRARSTKV